MVIDGQGVGGFLTGTAAGNGNMWQNQASGGEWLIVVRLTITAYSSR